MPMAYFPFALRSRSPYTNSMAYFHFVHRPLIHMFHSIFAWKRMHQSFWYSLHLKIYAFYCSFANYGTFFFVNKDTSAKFYTPEDNVGYHIFVSVKALNTECWDHTKSVFGKFHTRINIGNKIGRSLTVFCEPRTRMTRITTRMLVTCIIANFAADLSGRE